METAADTEFSEFMHGRWAQLVRLGYGLTGDQQLAEDLAQTALARAYASWPRVRRTGSPDAYVRRIMLNANYSRFRKRRVAERLTDAPPDAGIADPTGLHDDRSAERFRCQSLRVRPWLQDVRRHRGPGAAGHRGAVTELRVHRRPGAAVGELDRLRHLRPAARLGLRLDLRGEATRLVPSPSRYREGEGTSHRLGLATG
jgi:hypothetical protein